MATITDTEFGAITLRRSRLARNVRLTLDARGVISISLPMRAPLRVAQQLLNESRHNLRQTISALKINQPIYRAGDKIGKVHTLRFITQDNNAYNHRLTKKELIIALPTDAAPAQVQQTIHQGIAKALRAQAKAYLPRRLETLANIHGFTYQKLRFSSAGTRWGSCSNQHTISLNIWLMQLPFELIDYVLIHELCHTKIMNHSPTFWDLVAQRCPDYKQYRRQLKRFHPHA